MSIGKTRRRRKVTFKNMYSPDVMPAPTVESYDELVFNVAGLFHTMSFLHDPEDWGEDPTDSISSCEEYDPEPPLESRHSESVQQQQEEPEPESEKSEKSEKHKSKQKPVSWLNPPPISKSKDLDLLVDIINSCVYCGQFQFKKRDIVALCNVKV
ncbi:hypothetical protein BBO99_00005115 [Phytophthora kernoviae]|uniref:Uncharacterized protein n=2 Tax=Phytophthora kernoviae TaxID=325452 RepID=A0A3R7NFZ2_9STRA|nr:hypothetical protein G195_007215 [Phytophthora kernoviae 00238/432]KAG2510406.1 hypothetical protein JM16_008554 [Phytophthora kernoviae]KAG2512388.1 hypothetical protein JM18_008588 [Phytophthora kernoviae]RLN44349.1 hypothetical protein BBI17_005218 [Phytophthora kernoviae]RLN79656.1 hypothetical protein BBO99_00005115 [Phytophthora kernoviae]